MRKLFILFIYMVVSVAGIGQNSGLNSQKADQVRALMQSYQYTSAVNLANKFLADTIMPEMLLLKGEALEAVYRYKDAIQTLQVAKHQDSLNLQILNELVNIYREAGETDSAILINREICSLAPDNEFFTLQLANLYYSNKDYVHAKQILRPLYQKDTNSIYLIRQLALNYEEIKPYDSAEYFYQIAMKMAPGDPFLVSRLANLLIREERVNEAYGVTAKFLKVNPVNISILKINAYCNFLIYDYEDAAKELRKCIMLGDSSKFTRKYLALSYYDQQEFDTAAPYFLSLYRSDTTDAENCFYYGVCKSRINSPDTGILFLNKTLRILKPHIKFLSSIDAELAADYSHTNQPDTALALLQQALRLDPGNSFLQFKIAYQYDYYLHKPYKALPFYREFLKNAPPHAEGEHEKYRITPVKNGIPEIKGSCNDYAKNRIAVITGKR